MTAVTENQRTPLEQFVRDYLEVTGGVWDEIEPQVYDVLVAPDRPDIRPEEIDVCRIVFDTEALPEHPQAQLASFGTPLIDTFLQQAIQRARQLHLWRLVSHAIPHNLDARLGRAFTFPEGSTWECTRVRPLDFPQAVYWFQVTFSSDQREDDLIVAAVDLHYLRLMRHWERLLDPASLARQPSILLPEVRRATVAQGFDVAQQSALRTVSGLAKKRFVSWKRTPAGRFFSICRSSNRMWRCILRSSG
ncbi:MAG: hypothetical protein KatS3mg110_0619 [Pirellulaceae bacterium]|nr:MAG: hypothetical protein KatS3mg110_0619 [Pirellulaceae bacterium]